MEYLSFDGIYFHCLILLFSCIISTLLETKILNGLASLAMYLQTTLLSVLKCLSNSCSSKSFLIRSDTSFSLIVEQQ